MNKNTFLAITLSVIGFATMSIGSYISNTTMAQAQTPKSTLVPAETEMVHCLYEIQGIGDDADYLIVFPDRIEIYEGSDYQGSITTKYGEYELCDVTECQYHFEDGICTGTDFVVPYGTGNCSLLYGVYDCAPDTTNKVLIRKGRTVCQDEIIFYGEEVKD